MRTSVRSGALLVASGLLACLSFLWGFAASERRIPPHDAAAGVLEGLARAHGWVHDRLHDQPSDRGGLWRRAASVPGAPGALTPEQAESVERLVALGYMSGTQAAGAGETGVRLNDAERVAPGLNLVVSGHAPEAALLDAAGNVLHRWSLDYWTAFPGTDVPRDHEPATFWRRARLLPGGDLLAIFEGQGLVRLGRGSERVWAWPGLAHHEVDLDAQGRIWVLSREVRFLPRIHPDKPVLEDFVSVLDASGREARRFSVLEAFERSPYAAVLRRGPEHGDLFHTNALKVLDGAHAARNPAFRQGNLLISLLHLDLVAVLDPDREEVVWAMTGPWREQHDPTLLPNGNLLVFDNRGHRGMSKVVEVDPATQRVAWAYEGTPANGFFSETCGLAQRLPNGNTLITASEPGRAFEVTPGGDVVWDYVSPHRAGKDGEFVATLLEVRRLDPSVTPGSLGLGG